MQHAGKHAPQAPEGRPVAYSTFEVVSRESSVEVNSCFSPQRAQNGGTWDCYGRLLLHIGKRRDPIYAQEELLELSHISYRSLRETAPYCLTWKEHSIWQPFNSNDEIVRFGVLSRLRISLTTLEKIVYQSVIWGDKRSKIAVSIAAKENLLSAIDCCRGRASMVAPPDWAI